MKEELVTFQVAKLAKEKGFNIGCKEGWVKHFISGNNYIIDDLGNKHEIERPTQALLQKWLREVHEIHITIFSKSQESWMYRITKKGQSLEEGLYGEDFNSYEEALEVGLFEALTLIKI